MNRKAIVATVACLIMSPLPALVSAETYAHTRDGWLIGFGVGGGSAGISDASDRQGGVTGSFRAGYAFQPQLSLELNSGFWTKSEGGATTTFDVSGAALDFYPGEGGLVLRGGLGFGSADVSLDVGNQTLSASETGFGFLVGAGYEFRVLRSFAIGPEVEYGWTTLSSFDTNFVNANLGLTWYFIPK